MHSLIFLPFLILLSSLSSVQGVFGYSDLHHIGLINRMTLKSGNSSSPFIFERLDVNNTALLIVDHQVGLVPLVRDYQPDEFRNNLLAHAAIGNVFNLPTVLSSTSETGKQSLWDEHGLWVYDVDISFTGPNGPLIPEIVAMHPTAPYIKRQGVIDAWDDPNFRAAVQATGKQQLILAGITTDVRSL